MSANLGLKLAGAGRYAEAIQMTEDAVVSYRRLVLVEPVVFEPALAGVLNDLAQMFASARRLDEALTAIQEAVPIFRRLVVTNRAMFGGALANALVNLAARLSQLRQTEAALAACGEAVALYRRGDVVDPVIAEPGLAAALSTLGIALANQGRNQEAFDVTEEAAHILRRLTESNQRVFEPQLALVLGNLGNRLTEIGSNDEARALSEEAIPILRRLAATTPGEFEPHLAMALNNYGTRLTELGRYDDALISTEEAVLIYRHLTEADPAAFAHELAMSLSNLGNLMAQLGRPPEALKASDEAVRIYRPLLVANPAVFQRNLAGTLTNLANALTGLGQHQRALRATEEAVQLRRGAADDSAESMADLAESLNRFGITLVDLERHREASKATREAVEIYRQLARGDPVAFEPRLAMALWGHGLTLYLASDLQQSLGVIQESQAFYERLATDRPKEFAADLTNVYGTVAELLDKSGRSTEASEIRRLQDQAVAGPQVPRSCIFCGGPANSREHVYSDWMKDVLPVQLSTRSHFRMRSGPPNQRPTIGRIFLHRAIPEALTEIKIKCVCRSCNNGWMSDLDGTVKPILSPLILRKGAHLHASELQLVATWAAMKSMILEFNDPGTRTVPTRHHHWLKRHRCPPPRTRVWLAALTGPEWFDTTDHRGYGVHTPGTPHGETFNTHQTTIGCGHLLITVIGTTFRTLPRVPLTDILGPRIRQIWPRPEPFDWPPGDALADGEAWQVSGSLEMFLGGDIPARPDWLGERPRS